MKYVDFDDSIEKEPESSEVVQILESNIVEGKLEVICGTYDEHCFKIKFDDEETLGLGKTFFIQAAKSLPEGMQESFIKQLIG